ncbi:sugar phosphate isomerase/epimerase [Acidipila sp. EB88]|uniref:sugar phosphate isomerase/epimerase family protein n=1 Tax=Acidipila sp. EB88 TaxID=2305226 RepID=UPI000F5FDEFD|nr:sugar phosphate isomerase/epimerase family protein [Acidipila sp. EB88]RRA48393.1 sugar phosphate isomerase/epimerase [Acidipila sp. EB88]
MLKVISTHVFLRSRLHPGLLDTLARTGTAGIEIFAAREHFDYTDPSSLREIGDWFRANPVELFSMHAPLYSDRDSGRGGEPSVNVVHQDKSRRIDAMDEVKRALEVAEQIPFKHLVLHLGDRGDSWSARTLEDALTALEHLQTYARPLGVRLLVENIQNEVTTPAHLLEILNVGHLDDIGVCLDVGHAHLGDGVAQAIETLSPRIRTAHLHDNKGERDEHLWPGDGTIDFAAALAGLAKAQQQPAGILEIHHGYGTDVALVVERAKAAFAAFDGAAQH